MKKPNDPSQSPSCVPLQTDSDIVSQDTLQANFDTQSPRYSLKTPSSSCTFLASDKTDEGGGGGGGGDEIDDEEEKERMAEDPSSYLPSFSDQMIRDTSSRRVWRCTICNYETTDGKKKGGQLGGQGEIQRVAWKENTE